MVRKAAVVLSLLLMLVSTQAYAVGLGNITLDSALNQPFSARIEILDLGNVAPEDISITLASSQDFARFDVNRNRFLLNIQYQIEVTAAGVFVNLTTDQPVRDPFLSFILDTRWSSGRILSEHTVLLDLPVFDDNGVIEPINQPVSPVLQPPQGVVQRTPAVERTPAPAAVAPDRPAPVEIEPEIVEPQQPEPAPAPVEDDVAPVPDTVEVQASDTLWEVALRVRPDRSVSVQQTMLAIQRLNPDAFVNGNINRLRAGEILRVPDLSDIQSVDQQQAVSEVVRQNQQANLGAEPLAAPASGPSTTDAGQQGQLSVLTSEDAEVPANQAGDALADENAELDARIQALENQLALREEDADRARLQQEQLISRLDDLDAQIASALEIITLQDLQLAQLQESLAEAAVLAAQQEVVAEPDLPTNIAQPQQPEGIMESIMRVVSNSSLVLIVVVILVVLLLVTFLLRRSKSSNAELEDEFDELAEVDELAIEEEQSVVVEEPEDKDRFDELINVNEELERSPSSFEIETELIEPDDDIADDELIEEFDEGIDEENEGKGGDDLGLDGAVEDEPETELEETVSEESSEEIDEEAEEEIQEIALEIEEEAEEEPKDELDKEADEEPGEEIESEAEEELEKESETIIGLDESEDESKVSGDEEIDFDLDELLGGTGDDSGPTDSIIEETVDFDLAEFEDEVAEPGDTSITEIAEEVEDFDANDVDNNVEVMFDLADVDTDIDEQDEADTEIESIDDDSTLEFSTDEATDFIETGESKASGEDSTDTAVESVNFEVTDINLPDDIDENADLEEGLKEEHESIDFSVEGGTDDGLDFENTDSEEDDAVVETLSIDFSLESETEGKAETETESIEEAEQQEETEEIEPNAEELEVTEAIFEDEVTVDEVDEPPTEDPEEAEAEEISDDVSAESIEDTEENEVDEEEVEEGEEAETSVAAELDDLEFLATDAQAAVEGTEEEFDFLSDDDEAATKLDLAYAYQKMGDVDGAREILEEVISEGNESQITEAKTLLVSLN